MKWLLAALLSVLQPAAAMAQGAAPPPSVLVTVSAPRMGSVPRTVVGYGVVQAASGGSQTVSVLRATEVKQVLVAAGQTVRQGQALLVLGAEPSAIAAYRQAVSALALAQAERARLGQMLAEHLATRDQVSQATKAASDAQATLDVLRSGDGDSAGQTLRAAFDGVVTALPVAAGTRTPAQTPLIVLERSDSLVVAIGIEPSQRAVVQADQPARIEPLDGGPAQDGAVQAVGGMLDRATRLVAVLIRPSDGPNLLPGGAVRVSVRVGEAKGWLVPRAAVLTDDRGGCVYQVSGGKAVRVAVQVTGTAADETVVTGPVDPQRPIVSAGNYQLQDGMAVRTTDAKPAGVAAQ